MDIQAQVAARRAERERQENMARDDLRRHAAIQQQAATEQSAQALDQLAAELSSEHDVALVRKGDRLAFSVPSSLDKLDPADFRRAELKRMLWREALAEFKPFELLLVIAGQAVGLTLTFTAPDSVGPLLVIIASICAWAFFENHKRKLIISYPQLFGEFAKNPRARAGKKASDA